MTGTQVAIEVEGQQPQELAPRTIEDVEGAGEDESLDLVLLHIGAQQQIGRREIRSRRFADADEGLGRVVAQALHLIEAETQHADASARADIRNVSISP